MATYRTRIHVTLIEHLVDAAIGLSIGVVLGLGATALHFWLRFH